MKLFLHSIQDSLKTSNWMSALTLSLTIPDIAGKIEYSSPKVGDRYSKWFNKYISPKYNVNGNIFFSGEDCYALRCSFLHEGITNITNQRARKDHDKILFVCPQKGFFTHNNIINNKLQLQIDTFCMDMIKGTQQWLIDISRDIDKNEKLDNLFNFIDLNSSEFDGVIHIDLINPS